MNSSPRRALLFLGSLYALAVVAGAEPEIWFAPEDSIRRVQRGDPWKGDFMDLFPPDAPWKNAAARVQVFEIYPQFLSRASDDELRSVFEGLKRRNIALAISYGMLHRPKGAEMHEGYGAEIAERDIARLQRLGADVRYIVADEPLLFGHFYWGAGAPPLPIPEWRRILFRPPVYFARRFPACASAWGEGGQSAVFGFEHGLKEWGTKGDALAVAKAGDGAGDSSLEVTAISGQTFLLNSKKVPATAGREFSFDFDARARSATETGYLVVFFFDASKEVILRIAEPLVPENPRLIQNLVTDSDGVVQVPPSSPDFKIARELRLNYPGDGQRRPAIARLHRKP